MSKPQVTLTSLLSLWCFIATLRAFLILDLHFQDTARFILVLNFVSYSASETGLFLWFCSLFFWIRNAWDLIRGRSIIFSDVLFPLLMVFVHLDGLSCYCFGRCRTLKTALIFYTLCDNNDLTGFISLCSNLQCCFKKLVLLCQCYLVLHLLPPFLLPAHPRFLKSFMMFCFCWKLMESTVSGLVLNRIINFYIMFSLS